MPRPFDLPQLHRFDLLEEVGRGVSGIIFKARAKVSVAGLHPGAPVAVKILRPELAQDETARKAFLREARAGMRVRHPNLVRIYAVEEVRVQQTQTLYLVLEWLSGRTVRDWMQAEGLATEPTLRALARQTAGALAALHSQGLLHLDVKPENLMWDSDRAVLLDLGFVRPAASTLEPSTPREEALQKDLREAQLVLSATSSSALFVGTPAYAAPELLKGAKPGPVADLFSLGVTLYEAATGLRPFGDEHRYGLFEARRTAVLRRPSTIQPRLSDFFSQLVMQLLAEDPQKRLQSAAQLEQILQLGENSRWWQEQGALRPLVPLHHPNALPFGNRAQEFDILDNAFAQARRSKRVHVVLLHGPPAIGKSRMAFEFGHRQRRRSDAPPFLYGRCVRMGRGSAFRAVRDALARSLGLTPEQNPTANARFRLESALGPTVAETLIEILRGKPYPRSRRRIVFKEWLKSLGREGPLVVFFDDLQATGPALFDFVRELLELRDLPALVILAHRENLSEEAKPERQRLLRDRRVTQIAMRELDTDAIQELLRRCFLPGGLPTNLADDLLEVSQGVPGKLNDVLRLLQQRGDLLGKPGRFQAAHEDVNLPLTSDQAEILQAEIREMQDKQRELLQWAALLRPPLQATILAKLCNISENRATRILSILRDSGWLKLTGGHYRFNLPRLREAAYRSMILVERRRRHARLYTLLKEDPFSKDREDALLVLHAHRAGLHVEALQSGIPFLERLLAQSATERAEQVLETLWGHAKKIGWDKLLPAARIRLMVAKGRIAGLLDDHEQEAELLKEAGLLAQSADQPSLLARVHFGLSKHARSMGFLGAGRWHLNRARELGGIANAEPLDTPATERGSVQTAKKQ